MAGLWCEPLGPGWKEMASPLQSLTLPPTFMEVHIWPLSKRNFYRGLCTSMSVSGRVDLFVRKRNPVWA